MITGTDASPAVTYKADPLQAGWLPNEAIARAWMQYVKDTTVADTSPPPSPSNLRARGDALSWEAQADPESGLAGFVIERDGAFLANVPDGSCYVETPLGLSRVGMKGERFDISVTSIDTPNSPTTYQHYPYFGRINEGGNAAPSAAIGNVKRQDY